MCERCDDGDVYIIALGRKLCRGCLGRVIGELEGDIVTIRGIVSDNGLRALVYEVERLKVQYEMDGGWR